MSLASLLSSPMIALPLRNANFGLYSAGSAVSLIGMWMQRIAIGWLTWEITKSGLWLGIVAFADFFPVLLIGPIAGAAADRWDRLRVVKTSQIISLVQATLLFALTASGHINIGLLVALSAFQGVVVAFNQPARLALVPSLVAPKDLASAVAINSVVFNLARFIGPMFAGLAIVWSGVSAAFAANALSYVVFLAALARIRVAPTDAESVKQRSFTTDLREGIRYTAKHPAIAALLVLLIALGIGGRPLNELLPGVAADVFHSGAGGLSILASAIGGGAILGGLWVGHRAHPAGLTRVALGGSLAGTGGDRGDRHRAYVGRRAGRRDFRLLHVRGGDRHPDDHSARGGPQHARTRPGRVRRDFPRGARDRRVGGRARIGASRAAVAGLLRRLARGRGLSLDVRPRSQPQLSAPALRSPRVSRRRAKRTPTSRGERPGLQ
jgi:MFS family permease